MIEMARNEPLLLEIQKKQVGCQLKPAKEPQGKLGLPIGEGHFSWSEAGRNKRSPRVLLSTQW
jgi:hypothetical protein